MNENVNTNDEKVMKLLHYFITTENYNPIVLHGAQNEIWLENLDHEVKVVRIVTDYIHNDQQLQTDLYKTTQIAKKIKQKTFSFHLNVLSIFLNLGENVHYKKDELNHFGEISFINIHEIQDLNKYDFFVSEFPQIMKQTTFKEKGMDLFMKLTKEITKKSEKDAMKAEDVFRMKKTVITYILIGICVVLFLAMYLFGNGSQDSHTLVLFGANVYDLIKAGQWYRLLVSAFLHIGIFHLLCNMYSLYVIGPQLESFFGKTRFLIIYLFSALTGSLMGISFTGNIMAGASGAIFGLLGALLYFGYHYRVYLGGVIRSQIIPLLLLNLIIGFFPGVSMASHIGGFIGGALMAMAVGVKYKSTMFEKINGWILASIYVGFLIYLVFFH